MPRLLIEKGNDKGKTIPIPVKGTVIIGRDNSANIVIRDTMASRMHFKVESRDDGTWLVDLDSMNGTLHNNKPVKEEKLTDGDLIKVGETLFSYIAADTTGDDPMIGTRLGGYKIQERVGRGGMGVVYKAEQIDLQRIVALKVISEENCKNKDFVDLFVHEARAAAKLNHPNIVQVYDVKKYNELYYFSMEFVPGGSVQELLNKQKKIPVEQSVQMILDAARGLEYAHKKEIIHRDVKPDNFMISESGSIKIGDLGLAQRLGEKLSADDENSVIGTPHYIAPEQVLGKPADYRSDIYALGSTLYRMVAGFTPYQAPSIRDLINKKVREDAIPLHEACPGISKRLGEICAKMMQRQPDTRYQAMGEVVADLEKLQREMRGEVVKDPTAPVDTLVSNRRLLIAALAAMVLIVVGGSIAAVVVINKKPEQGPVTPVQPESTAEQDANRAYDAVKFIIAKLDRNRIDDLEKAKRELSDVIERHAKTKAATSAQRDLDDIERRLREMKAQIQLATIADQVDRANWTKMVQNFQAQDARLDFAPVDAIVQAYDAFRLGQGKETEAGADAERRVRHVTGWISAVQKARSDFDRAKAAARAKFDAERWQEAWQIYEDLKNDLRQRKMTCPFAEDRFTTLLYDDAANTEQGKINDAAKGAYVKIEQLSEDYRLRKDWKSAMEVLKPAIDFSIDHVMQKARSRLSELELDAARWRRSEEERLKALEKANLDADRKDFDTLAKEVRKLVVDFKYKSAADKMSARAGDFPRTEGFQKRRDERLADLQKLVQFKNIFLQAYNDPSNSQKVSKTWVEGGSPGSISKITDTTITIALEAGGTTDKPLASIPPKQFAAFLKKSWGKGMPLEAQIGFVVYCIEFGLFEVAGDELTAIQKAAAGNQVVLDWIERIRKQLETGESSESPEIEAEKHYLRLQDSVESGDAERARRDIEALKTKYADTKFVESKKKEIDALIEQLIKKGGDDFKNKLKDDIKKRVEQERRNEKGAASKEASDLLARLGRVPDVEHDLQLGEFHAGWQDWASSSTYLRKAKDKLIQMLSQSKEGRGKLLPKLELTYVGLLRNAILSGGNPTQVRNEALQRFSELGAGDGWTDTIKAIDKWEFDVKKFKSAIPGVAKTVDEEADPAKLWDLAQLYEAVRNVPEARACYRALINVFPDHDRVKSGDAYWRLAECCFSVRDIKEALDLYRKIGNEFPHLLRAKDKGALDSIPSRVEQCYALMTWMYPEEKRPKDPKERDPKDK